jgi:hypothetical protein
MGDDPAETAPRWAAGRVGWHDEPDRRRRLALIADQLEAGQWFSAEMPDAETEIAWPGDPGDRLPDAFDGLDVVATGRSPRVLDAGLNGFESPPSYPSLLSVMTTRAVAGLLPGEGVPDVTTEMAIVWLSLLPERELRRHVLAEGVRWLERRAAASSSTPAAARGDGWFELGLVSADRFAIDPDVSTVGSELRTECRDGQFVQLSCRAVHIHKVRLLPLAGLGDVASELRAEARLWQSIADQ